MALATHPHGFGLSTRWVSCVVKEWASPEHRSRRVLWLLFAITLMSVCDLYMTLTHAMGPGFLEGNPIARFVMTSGGAWQVIVYKLLTAGTSMLLLFFCRKTQVGELAAWLGVVMLLWLIAQWMLYMNTIETVGYFGEWLAAGGGESDYVLITSGANEAS